MQMDETNLENLPNTEVKSCRDCATVISDKAKKCSVCGSYQGLRRYFTASQSSITFLIAVVALIVSLSDWLVVATAHLRDILTGSRFDMDAQIVRIDDQQLYALIRNRRGQSLAVEGITCLVNPPVDLGDFALRRLRENDPAWSSELRATNDQERYPFQYLSGLQLRYELAVPQKLGSLDEHLFAFELKGVGWPGSEILSATALPSSFCLVTGASRGDPLSSGALLISDVIVGSIDAVVFLEREQDPTTMDVNNQRLELINTIERLREAPLPGE